MFTFRFIKWQKHTKTRVNEQLQCLYKTNLNTNEHTECSCIPRVDFIAQYCVLNDTIATSTTHTHTQSANSSTGVSFTSLIHRSFLLRRLASPVFTQLLFLSQEMNN